MASIARERHWATWTAVVVGALVATAVNLAAGSYREDFPINQSHQLPVVLWHWDPAPFANDAFVATLLKAPHYFWSFLALVLSPETLDAGLFAFFLLFKATFFAGVGALAAGLATRRRWLAALAAQALFLGGPPPALGGAVLNWDYLTHTQAAQALCVACLAAAAWGRWIAASAFLALATLAHPIFGVFGWAFYAPLALSRRDPAKPLARQLAERFLLPAIALAPMIQAAMERGGTPLPEGWADWIVERYATHHKPQDDDVAAWAFPAALAAATAWRGRRSFPRGAMARVAGPAWAVGLFAMWAVGAVGAIWLRAPFFLNLQPFRALAIAWPLFGATLAAAVVSARAPAGARRVGPLVFWSVFFLASCVDARWSGAWLVAGPAAALAWAAARLGASKGPARTKRRALRLAIAAWPAVYSCGIFALHAIIDWGVPEEKTPSAFSWMPLTLFAAWLLSRLSRSARRGARFLPLAAFAAIALWGVHLAAFKASKGESTFVAESRPAMRDVGAWIRANAPVDAVVAAPWGVENAFPAGRGLRGLRVAAWRSCVGAEMDGAGVYYDPAYLPEFQRLERAMGTDAGRAFLEGKSLAWLIAAEAEGATLIVVPDHAPMLRGLAANAPAWRPAYRNGAFAVLLRSQAAQARPSRLD